MKIVITADPFIPVPPLLYGGIERIVDSLCKGYAARGHEVHLIAHQDSVTAGTLHAYPPSAGSIRNILLFNKIKQLNPDVVHSFSRLAYLLTLLPSKINKVMSYQREPTISQIKKAALIAKKGTLHITGCSDYISNQIKPWCPSSTIYNGVEREKYSFTPSVEEDAPLVYLGRIEPIKGTAEAIRIATETGRRLIIAGNIPTEYQDYFDEKVKPFLNNRIVYIGPVDDVQKHEMLSKAAAFLMPILWNEPFGIVMAEAMACGVPVIGFRRGSVPEVVEDGVTGFIADGIDGAVEAVNKLKSISREAVYDSFLKRFEMNVIIDQYLNLYTSAFS